MPTSRRDTLMTNLSSLANDIVSVALNSSDDFAELNQIVLSKLIASTSDKSQKKKLYNILVKSIQ
jgi:hypothetical protein